jgi:hypothetical protein
MKTITTAELDEKFDNGEDISEHLDWSKATRPGRELTNVDIDLPAWMLRDLDKEAERLGVTREALLTQWIAERLEISRQSK